jgi:hypothetical protein
MTQINHEHVFSLAETVDTRLDQWLKKFPVLAQPLLQEATLDFDVVPVTGNIAETSQVHPDAFDARGRLFDPEYVENEALFGHLTPKFPEQSKIVLDRARHSADVLARLSEGTNLRTPENGLGLAEAQACINWLCEIQPSQDTYVYQAPDLLRFSLDVQLNNVKNRLLPHSLAAGLVSYHLALQMNRLAGHEVVNPYYVLIQNLIHESQRMITHDVIIHDALLPKVLLRALGHMDFAQDHGEHHPRILDVDAEELSLEQRIQFLLWPGDAFTKASPDEGNPFKTADGKPHFRRAEDGVSEVLNSLPNYNKTVTKEDVEAAKETGEYLQLLLKVFGHNIKSVIQYVIDLGMLSKIPAELEQHGVSLQAALDEVEPVWAKVLTIFWNNNNLSHEQMATVMNIELQEFLVGHPAR